MDGSLGLDLRSNKKRNEFMYGWDAYRYFNTENSEGGGREYGMERGREVIKHLHGVANPLRVKRISNFLDILVAYWWIFI